MIPVSASVWENDWEMSISRAMGMNSDVLNTKADTVIPRRGSICLKGTGNFIKSSIIIESGPFGAFNNDIKHQKQYASGCVLLPCIKK
jgi:hypothetical protein